MLDPGPSPDAPFELNPGSQFTDGVSVDNPLEIYTLVADPAAPLLISVTSVLPDGGPAVVFSDADGNTLGMFSQRSGGGSFILPPAVGAEIQIMVIHSGATRIENYQIAVTGFDGSATPR